MGQTYNMLDIYDDVLIYIYIYIIYVYVNVYIYISSIDISPTINHN